MAKQLYANRCKSGWLGVKFEFFNGTMRRPRAAVVGLQDASIYFSREEADAESYRAKGILGIDFFAVPVRIKGRDHASKVIDVYQERRQQNDQKRNQNLRQRGDPKH